MISKELCDTEDWSNDAEKFSFDHRIKLYSNRKVILNCNNISQYWGLGEQKRFLKILQIQNF